MPTLAAKQVLVRCPQFRHRFNHGEPSPNGALRRVLLGNRPTEIGQDAIAHVFGDMSLETPDFPRDRGLVNADDVTHLLGVQA